MSLTTMREYVSQRKKFLLLVFRLAFIDNMFFFMKFFVGLDIMKMIYYIHYQQPLLYILINVHVYDNHFFNGNKCWAGGSIGAQRVNFHI